MDDFVYSTTEPELGLTIDQPMWQQLIKLRSDTVESLQSQLRRALVAAILDGHIAKDCPLPSPRKLSKQLEIARNTAIEAYRHLVDEGYLIAKNRRGYFVNTELVSTQIASAPDPVRTDEGSADWASLITTRPSQQQYQDNTFGCWQHFEYPFISGQSDPALFPIHGWREACRQSLMVEAVNDWTPDSVDSDDSFLLEQIKDRVLPPRGLWVSTDQILVTMGSQNALYILAQLLMRQGTRVGFEDPGYPDARDTFNSRGCDLKPLQVDNQGLVVDDHINDCDLVYCTPGHQSPTTAKLSLERRNELLSRAVEHNILIIEDDYESELNYSRNATPALKSFDDHGRVIYVGSLSRTLAPGLRLGYLVGPTELIEEARALRRLMFRHPPSNNQKAIARFLALGHHNAFVRSLARAYKQRWRELDFALREFSPDLKRSRVCGGSACWIKLPVGVDADEVQRKATEIGILVVSGNPYYLQAHPDKAYLRIGFSSIATEKIRPGIKELVTLIRSLSG